MSEEKLNSFRSSLLDFPAFIVESFHDGSAADIATQLKTLTNNQDLSVRSNSKSARVLIYRVGNWVLLSYVLSIDSLVCLKVIAEVTPETVSKALETRL